MYKHNGSCDISIISMLGVTLCTDLLAESIVGTVYVAEVQMLSGQKARNDCRTQEMMSLDSTFVLKGAKQEVNVINKRTGGNNMLFL